MTLRRMARAIPGVLIAEDAPAVRSFLRAALEPQARVVEAHDGERAIEILRDRAGADLDLVVTDYRLPKRSGLEVLQAAKALRPSIPVIVITAFGSEELAVQVFRKGATDYLTKPIALEAFRRRASELLAARDGHGGAEANDPDARLLHPRISRAIAHMHQHFTENLTLTGVAGEVGFSRFHFCRLFHRQTGVAFHDYLHQLRVARAKTLLVERDLSVTEVAYAVGFNDLSHFDKTFRRIAGGSPTQFRAAARAHQRGQSAG